MSASPEELSTGGRLKNMTVDECFQSRSTVLQGQPFGGVPTVLCLNIALWVVSPGHCRRQTVKPQTGLNFHR